MNRPKKNWLDYVSVFVLIAAILILVVLNIFWGNNWIDSDMAAEMIFSRLLAEEGSFIATSNWYYSTEFRVLYTQLVMVPLHLIFSDWHVIRVITNFIFYGLMLASFYFVCKPLHIRKRNVRLCALALFVPVSEAVMTHLQMGNTYMSHVILSFLTFGLYLRLCDRSVHLHRKRLAVYAILFGVLCMILGVSGVRYLLDLIVPMAVTSFVFWIKSDGFQSFRKKPEILQFPQLWKAEQVKYLFVSLGAVICGGIGYLINALFISKMYQFQTYDTTNFIAVHEGVFWDRVQNALGELLQMFGYIENKSFLSLRGIITMLSFVMIGVLGFVWFKCLGYCKAKKILLIEPSEEQHRRFTVLFAGVSLILHLFVFIFTTSTMVDRYFITITIFFILTLAVYMEWESLVFDRAAVCLILTGCLALAGVKTYYSFVTNDKNESRYDVIECLTEEGYAFGYASYWNANIMTELSDGELEIANLWSADSLGEFKWSSKVSSYEPKDGKVFLLIDKSEQNAVESHGINESSEKLIYESSDYMVFHFDSQEDFLKYREN